jgi:hypothetical protein
VRFIILNCDWINVQRDIYRVQRNFAIILLKKSNYRTQVCDKKFRASVIKMLMELELFFVFRLFVLA